MSIEPAEKTLLPAKGTGTLAQVRPDSIKLRRSIAAIALIALVMDSLTIRSLILLAPFIRSGLRIGVSQYGYIPGALMAGTVLTILPLGSMVGRLNSRRAFGTILIASGILLFVLAWQVSLIGLIVTIFIYGIVRAGVFPLVNRTVAEQFDPAQRGAINGVIFAAVPLGGFLGALVLPAIAQHFNWSAGYRLLGTFALIGGFITWFLLPKESGVYSSNGASAGLRSFLSKPFIVLSLAYGLFDVSMTAETFVTLYLVDVVKISAVIAGVFFGLIQLTGVGGRVFWGILADRYFRKNRWWLLAFTTGLTSLSFVLLISLNSKSPYWLIGLAMVGFGVSAASSWGILSTLVADVVGIAAVAAATATVYFLTNVADAGGPVLFSNVLRITGSYQNALSIYMVIAVVTSMIFTWMALRRRSSLKSGTV
jgi:MFS family permease